MGVSAEHVLDVPINVRLRNYRGKQLVVGYEHTLELSTEAAFVWQQIDGRRSVADIAGLLAAEYVVDPEVALQDTIEMLDALVSHQLLEMV